MSINKLALLDLLADKPVKITMKDGKAFICEPVQLVFDRELESYHVYITDGMSSFASDTYMNVYTPDIALIEELPERTAQQGERRSRG